MSIGRATGILGMSTVALLIVGLTACGIGSSPEDALIKDGKATYERHCLNCHGEAGTGEGGLANAPVHGPDGHTWHHPDGQLKELIPAICLPEEDMPSFVGKLSDSDSTPCWPISSPTGTASISLGRKRSPGNSRNSTRERAISEQARPYSWHGGARCYLRHLAHSVGVFIVTGSQHTRPHGGAGRH